MKRSMDAIRFSGAGLFFAVAALLTLMAALVVYSYMRGAVQTEAVLVATHDLLPGATLTDRDFAAKPLPTGGIPAQAIRDPRKAIGQRVRFGVVSGDVIQTGQLVKKGGDISAQVAEMGEEFRAVMIPGELVPATDRLVPGDRLELTGVLPVADQKVATSATIPLGLATVLDVPHSDRASDHGMVLVAVKAEEASALALTMRSGTLLVSVLPNENSSPAAPPMRLDGLTSVVMQAKPAPTQTQAQPPQTNR